MIFSPDIVNNQSVQITPLQASGWTPPTPPETRTPLAGHQTWWRLHAESVQNAGLNVPSSNHQRIGVLKLSILKPHLRNQWIPNPPKDWCRSVLFAPTLMSWTAKMKQPYHQPLFAWMDWCVHHQCPTGTSRHSQRLETRVWRWWQRVLCDAIGDGSEAQSNSVYWSRNAWGF